MRFSNFLLTVGFLGVAALDENAFTPSVGSNVSDVYGDASNLLLVPTLEANTDVSVPHFADTLPPVCRKLFRRVDNVIAGPDFFRFDI
jgi:hypothetical protein